MIKGNRPPQNCHYPLPGIKEPRDDGAVAFYPTHRLLDNLRSRSLTAILFKTVLH